MKKKGFTLMEMIVTMLLIGIVITVAVPAVRNLTYNSGTKKYNQMEKVIVEASKLYAASYQGELINTSYECFNIPYSTLVKEELIEEEDITCSGQVILRKREKVGYNYEPYLTCTDSKGKVVHEESRPSTLVNCIGFSGNFKVEYALYNDEEYSNNYTIGNWEKYVYGKYNSVSPYGTGIEKYQYTKDLLNWIDMTGDSQDYTNFNGTIYIRAIDQDGNKSSVAHHLIRTDTIGPSYALTNNEHKITEDNKMLISISNVKDNGVGIEESGNIYSFDGGTTWVNRTSQEFALATTGEVQVKDKLANVTSQPLSVIKACSGNQGASATADKILTGYSSWVNGTLVSGSMANNGAVNKTLNPGESYTIPKGFHNGSGKITVSSLASNTSATATAGQILTGQTAWVNGTKVTGTMENRSGSTVALSGYETVSIQPHPADNSQGLVTITNQYKSTGYYDSTTKFQTNIANLNAGNIKAGVAVGQYNGNSSNSIVGTFTSDATAAADHILSGKTAYVNGSKVTGTMANNGTLNWAPTTGTTYTVPAGYYSGGTLESSAAYNAGYAAGKAAASSNTKRLKSVTVYFTQYLGNNKDGNGTITANFSYDANGNITGTSTSVSSGKTNVREDSWAHRVQGYTYN